MYVLFNFKLIEWVNGCIQDKILKYNEEITRIRIIVGGILIMLYLWFYKKKPYKCNTWYF